MSAYARIESDNGNLAFYSPYDAGLVADFKARISSADRRWDGARKCWLVTATHLPTIEALCDRHGLTVVKRLTPVYSAPRTVQRIMDVRYIGAPKEREDGSITAFGNSGGDWSVVFPQAVLRGWFEIGGVGDAPAPAPTAAMTYYGALGVPRTTDAAALKAAYRNMAKRWHPDVNRDPDATEMFKRIGRAYEILSDPAKRARYDAGLALEASLSHEEKISARHEDRYWRPPLRCGLLLLEGTDQLGRLIVAKILAWQPIVNAAGRELVTSWPFGQDTWTEQWV